VFDIATLYHTTSGKITTADLPRALTPAAVLDTTSGWLTGVSETMQYSLDGGMTWTFAGGTSVLLDLDTINATEIWVKDIGTATTAPSEVQIIPTGKENPPVESPETPDEDESQNDDTILENEEHICEKVSGWKRFWNNFINFFRRLFGQPERCPCGEVIKKKN
jgi:hypothetical protein